MDASGGLYSRTGKFSGTSLTNKCIVIDLDLTLISTQDSMDSLTDLRIFEDPKLMDLRSRIYHISLEDMEKPGIGTRDDYWGITRPHINEFLMFCFSYFRVVAVWSAGQRSYVEAIVDHIFRDTQPPHVIFTANDCIPGPFDPKEKPLMKMIRAHPVLGRYMFLENTYALDDNPDTFTHNENNAIYIPKYMVPLNARAFQADDPTLLQLMYWLLQPEVAAAEDVRTLPKDHIFDVPLKTYIERHARHPGYEFVGRD